MVVSEDDILVSVTIPQLIKDEFIKAGTLQLLPNGDPVLYTGGFAMVFPVIVNNKKWAFRCWRSTLSDLQERYKFIWDYLKTTTLPYFCKGEFIEKGIVVAGNLMPTSRMEWVDGTELKDYIIKYRLKPNKVSALAEEFRKMCIDLHNNNISHGDLQHGNILICEKPDGTPTIKLVDYDSLYVPTMGKKFKDLITGLKDYQHPARLTASHISSHKTDYFSELVIYLSLIAIAEKPDLCTKYEVEDRDALLFTQADFRNLKASKIYSDLRKLSNNVQLYLNVLEDYLKVTDIENLKPFTSLVDIDSLIKDVKSKFDAAKKANTIAAYKKFLNECPDTAYTREYRTKAQNEIDIFNDVILWTATVASGTVEAYSHYLSHSKKLSYLSQAHKKIDELAWERARFLGTGAEYKNYLKTSSTKEHALDAYIALEGLYYNAAISNNSVKSFNSYLTKSNNLKTEANLYASTHKKLSDPKYIEYLNKVAADQAKVNGMMVSLENDIWTSSQNQGTVAAYEVYLTHFPKGKYVTQCKARIDEIKANEHEEEIWKKAKQGHSFTSYRNYLKNTTIGKYRLEANKCLARCEDELWKKTVQINTKEAYQNYLAQTAIGKYRTTANSKISHIDQVSRVKKIAIAAVIIIAVVFGIHQINMSSEEVNPVTGSETHTTYTQPTYVNLSALEDDMQNKLNALELQKRNGKALDQAVYTQARNVLNELKNYGSSKYQSYKIRFDKL